jgi:hypothetical protein
MEETENCFRKQAAKEEKVRKIKTRMIHRMADM